MPAAFNEPAMNTQNSPVSPQTDSRQVGRGVLDRVASHLRTSSNPVDARDVRPSEGRAREPVALRGAAGSLATGGWT